MYRAAERPPHCLESTPPPPRAVGERAPSESLATRRRANFPSRQRISRQRRGSPAALSRQPGRGTRPSERRPNLSSERRQHLDVPYAPLRPGPRPYIPAFYRPAATLGHCSVSEESTDILPNRSHLIGGHTGLVTDDSTDQPPNVTHFTHTGSGGRRAWTRARGRCGSAPQGKMGAPRAPRADRARLAVLLPDDLGTRCWNGSFSHLPSTA